MYHKYTNEQKQFIYDHVKGITSIELTKLFNARFELDITPKKMKAFMGNHNLTNGVDASFKKGCEPINKGTKGMFNVGGNKTSFKKGQQSVNTAPLGSEAVKSDGYVYIKTNMLGRDHREMWTRRSKVVWESVNGILPAGCYLLHLDGNRTNDKINNLKAVSKAEMLIINKQKLIYDDPKLTASGVMIAQVLDKTYKSINKTQSSKKDIIQKHE